MNKKLKKMLDTIKYSNIKKGVEFEKDVEEVLRNLENKFKDIVKVKYQPIFNESTRPHRADFELEYKLGGLTHQHLIECQNRKKSSYEITDKIYSVRGTSDRNRYIFVYKDPNFLNNKISNRLKEMGVLSLDFENFKKFIKKLDEDITLIKLAQEIILDSNLSKYENIINELRINNKKSNSNNYNGPIDRAQL